MNALAIFLSLFPDAGALPDVASETVALHDVDLDGTTDVLVHLEDRSIAIYLKDGRGELRLATEALGLSPDLRAIDVAWLDIDLDEDVDLVVLDQQRTLRAFLNLDGLMFVEDAFVLEPVAIGPGARISTFELGVDGSRGLVLRERDRSVILEASSGGLRIQHSSSNTREPALGAGFGGMPSTVRPGSGTGLDGAQASTACADRLADMAGGACLRASSSPQLDHLYPLSQDWMIANDGAVGLGTLDPRHRLHVQAPWNTQGWGDAIVVSQATNDTVGLGIYNDTRKWDLANLISDNRDRFVIRDSTAGKNRFSIDTEGHVGVATNVPEHLLHVRAPWNTQGWGDAIVVSQATNDTIGLGIYNDTRKWDLANLITTTEEIFAIRDSTAGSVRLAIDQDGQVGIGTASPQSTLDVRGRTRVEVLEITGGMDIVERFDTGQEPVEPGTVVVIAPDGSGGLQPSSRPYDRAVAGVVSGAGGIHPGLALSQEGVMTGKTPVALTGRVYARASAENGPIRPGDRLTTAGLLGHAMKATDRERCDGAVIGKAMSSLDAGSGLVLVLVNLQ